MNAIANQKSKTVGEYVTEDYRIAEVFEKHGIDFCCGGQRSLVDISREKGLSLEVIQQEIDAATKTPVEKNENYSKWELSALIDHIVNTHHAYLNNNNDVIAQYANKIADVHGEHHPEVIEIAETFNKIVTDMAGHLQEEEEILFPLIKKIEKASKSGISIDSNDRIAAKSSLDKLVEEHDEIGSEIHSIRHLSKDYAVPDDVCNTFVVTYQKLQDFENDLHKHVHRACKKLCVNGLSRLQPVTTGGTTDDHPERPARLPDEGLQES